MEFNKILQKKWKFNKFWENISSEWREIKRNNKKLLEIDMIL